MALPKSLDALRRVLERPEDILLLAAKSVGEESINLIKDGFRGEKDPYGDPWAPKVFPDARKVLSGRTSRLKNGWKLTQVTKEEIRVSPSVDYAKYHQEGTGIYGPHKTRIVPKEKKALSWKTAGGRVFAKSVKGVPKRLMVPDARGLPPRWSEKLSEAANDAFAAAFGADGRRVSALRKILGTDAFLAFKTG